MKGVRFLILAAAWLCAGLVMDVGAASTDVWARSARPRVPRVRAFHALKAPRLPHARRYTSRSVTVRRADGATLRGYRENSGTHLRGPNGRSVDCRKSSRGIIGDEIVCR